MYRLWFSLLGAVAASGVWAFVHYAIMEQTLDHELYRSIRVQGRDDRGRMLIDMKANHSIAFGTSEKPGVEISLQKNGDGFWVNAKVHPDTVLKNVSVWRESTKPYDGKIFEDRRGQRWELVSRDLSGNTFYQERPDLLLKQGVWSGNIRTDGDSVFLHVGEDRGTIRETWRLIVQ